MAVMATLVAVYKVLVHTRELTEIHELRHCLSWEMRSPVREVLVIWHRDRPVK